MTDYLESWSNGQSRRWCSIIMVVISAICNYFQFFNVWPQSRIVLAGTLEVGWNYMSSYDKWFMKNNDVYHYGTQLLIATRDLCPSMANNAIVNGGCPGGLWVSDKLTSWPAIDT